jgi:hypothetical protein
LLFVNFGSRDFLLQLEHGPFVCSLHDGETLLLFVFELQFAVLLLFSVVLEIKLNLRSFSECSHQSIINTYILDATLLENNSVISKLSVQIIHKLWGHIRLQVKDLGQPDSVDEISDSFLNFCLEKLVESSSSQSVNESLYLLFNGWKTESKMDVDVYIGIVFGWAALDWSIVVNRIFCNHASNSSVAAETEMSASSHDTL